MSLSVLLYELEQIELYVLPLIALYWFARFVKAYESKNKKLDG
jgi:hypothetical protein